MINVSNGNALIKITKTKKNIARPGKEKLINDEKNKSSCTLSAEEEKYKLDRKPKVSRPQHESCCRSMINIKVP